MDRKHASRSPGRRTGRRIAVAVIATLAAGPGAAAADAVINPDGGQSATDGLRVTLGPDTRFQIHRAGAQQLYKAEGLALAVGSRVTGAYIPGADSWTPLDQTAVVGQGTEARPYRVTTAVTNRDGFVVVQTVRYVALGTHLDVEVTVTAPSDNDAPLKLYHLTDTYLAGGDTGAAFWQPDAARPSVLGAIQAVGGASEFAVFSVGNRPWDHFHSAHYLSQYRQAMHGGDLDDELSTSSSTDNGVGVQWNLGVVTGSITVRYRMAFASTATMPACGDGHVDGFESCDDGDDQTGDGCSDLCQIEDGWTCAGTPSLCRSTAVCGDAVVGPGEPCDDGNLDGGDGCSAGCQIEDGWACAGNPSACDVDFDRDGTPDATDVCPDVHDPDQHDFDGDGMGDLCDPAPYEPGVGGHDRDGTGGCSAGGGGSLGGIALSLAMSAALMRRRRAGRARCSFAGCPCSSASPARDPRSGTGTGTRQVDLETPPASSRQPARPASRPASRPGGRPS